MIDYSIHYHQPHSNLLAQRYQLLSENDNTEIQHRILNVHLLWSNREIKQDISKPKREFFVNSSAKDLLVS